MNSTSVTVSLPRASGLGRLSLGELSSDATLSDVVDRLEPFAGRPSSFVFTDCDGDVVTIATDAELVDAIKLFQGSALVLRAQFEDDDDEESFFLVETKSQLENNDDSDPIAMMNEAFPKVVADAEERTKSETPAVLETATSPEPEPAPPPASSDSAIRFREAFQNDETIELFVRACRDPSKALEVVVENVDAFASLFAAVPELKHIIAPKRDERYPVAQHAVRCDGCASSKALRLNSFAHGTRNEANAVEAPILGTRYKSAVIKEFDLCATCENSGAFDSSAPFLKIDAPHMNPESIVCVLPSKGFSNVKEDQYVRKKKRTSCPCGHLLVPFTTSTKAFSCDVCSRRVPVGSGLLCCRACDYDVCEACQVLSASDRCDAPLRAKFLSDDTLRDGSLVAKGQLLLKTWSFRNVGLGAWPPNVALVLVAGNEMSAPDAVYFQARVERGDCVSVSVPLLAPSKRGRALGYYRLVDPRTGKKFGDRVFIDVVVGDETDVDALELAGFKDRIDDLHRLGLLTDTRKAVDALKEFGGDMERVAARLKDVA